MHRSSPPNAHGPLLFDRADTIVRLPGTGSAKTDHARKPALNESLRAALNVFADPRFLFHGWQRYAHLSASACAESHSNIDRRLLRAGARVDLGENFFHPNVKSNTSAPGSRNSISSCRSAIGIG